MNEARQKRIEGYRASAKRIRSLRSRLRLTERMYEEVAKQPLTTSIRWDFLWNEAASKARRILKEPV